MNPLSDLKVYKRSEHAKIWSWWKEELEVLEVEIPRLEPSDGSLRIRGHRGPRTNPLSNLKVELKVVFICFCSQRIMSMMLCGRDGFELRFP